MNNYEAMFIVNPNLSEDEKNNLLAQLGEVMVKNNGEVVNAAVWSERRKLCYPIKKIYEGIYFLINFKSAADVVAKLKKQYKLNENILRVMIVKSLEFSKIVPLIPTSVFVEREKGY